MGPSEPFLDAFIELRKRHWLEWDLLAIGQQTFCRSIREKDVQQLVLYSSSEQVCINLKRLQINQLIKVIAHQCAERDQLQARHLEEEIIFKQNW